jgi:hypothetical protein
MAVGEDEAIGRNDHTGAGAAALPTVRSGGSLNAHDSGPNSVKHLNDGLRVGIQQQLISIRQRSRRSGVTRVRILLEDESHAIVKHQGSGFSGEWGTSQI